jgi:hypothetical protein
MLVSEMQIYKIYLLKRHYDFDVVKNGTGTNLIDASFLKDRIKRSYLQLYQLKFKKLRE